MLRHCFDTSGKTPVELYHSRDRRARTVTGCGLFVCLPFKTIASLSRQSISPTAG